MSEPAVFLIHGLGGTQYDLGSMHKRLKRAGFVTHSLTLPGHGTRPEDLAGVHAEDWLEAVRTRYLEVIAQHEVVHLMGMCMGSLLAVETAKRERHTRGRLIALAPPVFIDGWATPWYRMLRPLLYLLPGVPQRMRVEEEEPFGIRNEQLREIVKAKFARGDAFHYQWVPLACIREVDRLRGFVMKGLERVPCPTLVVHARRDELTSLRSAHYLVEHIGKGKRAGQARMVILENSYHMVCVDNDREFVASRVLEFLEATAGASLGMAVDDARMTPAQIAELLDHAQDALTRGDFGALYARGTDTFAWFHPGANRATGVYRGNDTLARLQAWAGEVSYTAFGLPVVNAGMAVVPATLQAGPLVSQGVIAFVLRDGRLLEARWFPDDVALEDAHFGGAPLEAGPTPAERAFASASALSKTLRKALDEATLLKLYALYKQAGSGDANGERPGVFDPVARAKYDAWAALHGLPRERAMQQYTALVNQLKAAEAQHA